MLDHERFNIAFNNLQQAVADCDEVFIEFLGGEPTISRAVREAITQPVDPKFKFNITSNGSADLEWWAEAAPNLNLIMLAWHYKADTNHFKQVVELLSKTHDRKHLVPTVNASPETWDEAMEIYHWLKDNGYNGKIKILFSNHNKGNDRFFRSYTPEQVVFYCKENGLPVPDLASNYSINAMEESLYTDYKTHLCWAGVEQIVIDYFGYVYRGWCMVGNGYGNIFEKSITLDVQPKICTRVLCKNGFDQGAKKSEKGWGI